MDVKVAHDRHYLEQVSPGLDLVILARTPGALLSSRGVF
jgi:lipopolysaccharide/colanic/teichoic acid biosynthesis glycosyltransferase